MAVPKDRDQSRAASLHMQRIAFIARKKNNHHLLTNTDARIEEKE